MDCNEARDRLNARLDGDTAYVDLDRHVRSCATCRRYAVEMDAVAQALCELRRDTESIVPPATGKRCATPIPRASLVRSWVRAAGGIAAAIAIVTGSWHYMRPRSLSPIGTPDAPVVKLPNKSIDAVVPGETNPLLGITLRGESARRFLVVADASSNDTVQVYHLYPVLPRSSAGEHDVR